MVWRESYWIESAEKEFADEQCRLLGLLQDSVDTGYNTVSSGTSSLDVQISVHNDGNGIVEDPGWSYYCSCYWDYLSWFDGPPAVDNFDNFCSYAKPIAGGTAFVAGTAAGGLAIGGALGITELGSATSITTAGHIIWNEATVVSMTGTMFPAAYVAGSGTGTGTVIVTRWGRPGLQPGDWVMPGGKTGTNYLLSCKWQPGMTNQFAWFGTGQTYSVPGYTVRTPVHVNLFDNQLKGLFNQRIYDPSMPVPAPYITHFDIPSVITITPTVPIEKIDINIIINTTDE